MPPCNLLPPTLWQSVPFGDKDAFLDWNGHHMLWHQALAVVTGTEFLILDDLRSETLRHAEMHNRVDKALGIPISFDLVSFDLQDRASFESFMQSHGAEHQRQRLAAGL